MTALSRLLRSSRLITLFGPAGVGKTRMALEVANRARRAFPGGVYLVELGPLNRPEFVIHAVATAVGVSEQPGKPLIDTLVASMQGEELLLVLDNCEHVVDACSELVVSLLGRCRGPHILATSREALRLPGELIFASGALPLDDAVQLFADRAGAAASTFALTARNRRLVELICRRLDRLPLAIELAARIVRLLPLQDIVDGMEDRFALLTSSSRGVDTKHRDLLAAIEWSYELLSPAEKAMFRRLSILPGGFDLELARAVSADPDLSISAIIDLVSSLESKSLIAPTLAADSHARFRQLESVRAYAQRQLVDSGELASTAELLVTWLTRLASPFLDRFLTVGDVLERLDVEYDNLLQAVEYLAKGDDHRQLLLVGALARCGDARGGATYGEERMVSALRLGDGPPAYRIFALEQATWLAARRGDHDRSVRLAQQAVELARQCDDTTLLCRSLSALAYARQLRGELAEAIDRFTECLDQVRGLHEPESTALCLNNLAWATMLAGDIEGAGALVVEALPTCQQRKAALLHTAGVLELERGHLTNAERSFAESLLLLDPYDGSVTPFSLEGLGVAAVRDGRVERGLRLVAAADTIRRKSGHGDDPWWRERVTSAIESAAKLAGKRLEALLTEGRRLPVQQAIAYALNDTWIGSRSAVGRVPLTKRESEVVTLVTQGLTNREISVRLGVSERTVESHVEHVRTKLDLRSRAQIAAWAAAHLSATPIAPSHPRADLALHSLVAS
jgi:predicted ATPase/DNA-binding CsgD family transcriptional regulator